jgi:OOP family OmpA-OmpF porin
MLKKILGVSIITAGLFAGSVNNKFEVGIGAGYMHTDKSNQIDHYGLVNVRVGKYLPKNHILRFELEDGDGNNVKRVLLNIEHYFPLESKITPYAYLGAGKEWINKTDYNNNFVADLGLGAKYSLTDKFNLFAEARGLRNFSMNDNHYGAIIGINYEFGKNKVKVIDSDNDGVSDDKDKCPNTSAGINVDSNGCPLDSDNDGILDYWDECPNTPKGIKVLSNGCPVKTDSDSDGVNDDLDKCPNTPKGIKVLSNGCPVKIDSDFDGINDDLDKCPKTPKGAKVDKNGCPIDSDKDGVPDYWDECSNTPKGVKVLSNGCFSEFNFNINFKTNSSIIIDKDMTKVDEFVKFLKQNPAYKVEIEGYTDNRGSKQYNIKLSEKRAEAVYNYLIKSGISADRLSYKGYGPANPVADNNTKEGRKLNRRVVAKIIF